jgi:hypothetical protein
MANQIIKQPNGKYAIWSSVVDGFILCNLDSFELFDYFDQEARSETRRKVNEILTKLENDEKPYAQFTMTWEEATKEHNKTYEPININKV